MTYNTIPHEFIKLLLYMLWTVKKETIKRSDALGVLLHGRIWKEPWTERNLNEKRNNELNEKRELNLKPPNNVEFRP